MARKGLTLVELLIAVGILVTISAILVLILNPVEYLKRARDAQRLKDYALINQAVNFYSYNSSVKGGELDLDGPNYADSCKSQSSQRIFVSVPDDNGESSPTPPPSGWTYVRTSSTNLRYVNGSGWLPIDFTNTGGSGIQPLNILPVDPINTFESGFYYTYTCGSYELNLRFESEKYQALADSDGGTEGGVYELGSDLSTAPFQDSYHPTSTTAAVPAPTMTFAASPTSIISGNSSTLSWYVVNAASCTASGAWVGSKATSGSEFVSPISSATYLLTCNNSEGVNVNGSASITVAPLPSGTGTLAMLPSADGFYSFWNSTEPPGSYYAALSDANDTTYIQSPSSSAQTFRFTAPTSTSGTISAVKLSIRAKETVLNATHFQVTPRVRDTSLLINKDFAPVQLSETWQSFIISLPTNPSGGSWTWSDFNNLEAGLLVSQIGSGGMARVAEMGLKIERQ